MRRIHSLMIVVAALGGLSFASPISVSFISNSQNVTAGQTVNVDVGIFGLGNFAPPTVGSFDLTAGFDPNLLLPTDVAFGPFLGDPSLFEAITAFQFSAAEVEFTEISLLSPVQLDAMQPGNFVLATLSFTALTSGTAQFQFTSGVVDDPYGQKLFVVPEPGSLSLLVSGLLGLSTALRRGRGRRFLTNLDQVGVRGHSYDPVATDGQPISEIEQFRNFDP